MENYEIVIIQDGETWAASIRELGLYAVAPTYELVDEMIHQALETYSECRSELIANG